MFHLGTCRPSDRLRYTATVQYVLAVPMRVKELRGRIRGRCYDNQLTANSSGTLVSSGLAGIGYDADSRSSLQARESASRRVALEDGRTTWTASP